MNFSREHRGSTARVTRIATELLAR